MKMSRTRVMSRVWGRYGRALGSALIPGLLAFAAWHIFLGRFDPNYSVAQVAGLVVTLLAIGIGSAWLDQAAGAWLGCASTVVGVSVGCWIDWSDDITGMFMIGWFMVTMGALVAAFLLAATVMFFRGGGGGLPFKGGRFPVAPFAVMYLAGVCTDVLGDLGLRPAAILAAVLISVGAGGAAVAAYGLLRSPTTPERAPAWCGLVGSLATLGVHMGESASPRYSNSVGLGVVLMLGWALFAVGAFSSRGYAGSEVG